MSNSGEIQRAPSMSSSQTAEAVVRAISEERFSTYLRAANGNAGDALRLYEYNINYGARAFGLIGIVEVVVRNHCHDLLKASGTEGWYKNGLLDHTLTRHVQETIMHLAAEGRTPTSGRVVAGLSFTFWKRLFSRKHKADLWGPYLSSGFPHVGIRNGEERRDHIYRTLSSLVDFRNRVAHHEPIFQPDPVRAVRHAYAVLGWIDPQVEEWARNVCGLNDASA